MKRISVIVFVLLVSTICWSQVLPSVPSPTAANLGVYGEVSVSPYTGTPNIAIPLYELKGKKITIPVSLTYHPASIRPEIHPGPTGLGWTLQAGGAITRTVRGNGPDEWQQSTSPAFLKATVNGYLSAQNWIAGAGWKTYLRDQVANQCSLAVVLAQDAPANDLEPDEFNFSLPGLSGKFYFDQNKTIQVQCDRPVKVIFDDDFGYLSNSDFEYASGGYFNRYIRSFSIIDEYGACYSFGGLDAIEFSDPIVYGGTGPNKLRANGYLFQAVSWFLTKIESADGSDLITFEYERGPFVSQLYRSVDVYNNQYAGGYSLSTGTLVRNGTIICPVYLKKISRLHGEEISFILSESTDLHYTDQNYDDVLPDDPANYPLLSKIGLIPRLAGTDKDYPLRRFQWLKLDTLTIKDVSGIPLKAVTFSYNSNTNERLFLEGIHIHGINTMRALQPPMRYGFLYKDRQRLFSFKYLDCITDHWGFLNGKGYLSSSDVQTLRMPDTTYTDNGVLSEIHYPTGGYTRLHFEAHDYAKIVDTKNRNVINNQSGIASGLRIRKVESRDSAGGRQVREYFYRETPSSSNSTGVLNAMPTYVSDIGGYDCNNNPFSMWRIHSNPAIPLTKENDGRYIGYTKVCESFADGTGGYIQYQYTNHDNGYYDTLLSGGQWNRDSFPEDPYCSRYFERGRLMNEKRYNASGDSVYVQETLWERYGSQGEDNPRAMQLEGWPFPPQVPSSAFCSSASYLHFVYKFLPKQQAQTVFDADGQNPVTTVTKYRYTTPPYNPIGLLSKETICNSDSDSLSTGYRYAGDVLGNSAITSSQNGVYLGIVGMLDRHMVGITLEKTNQRNGNVTDANVHYYLERDGQLQPAVSYRLQSTASITNYTPFGINAATRTPVFDSRLAIEMTNELYDSQGNLLQATGVDDITISYLWGYDYQYLIAKVVGAPYAAVKSALGHGSDTNDLAYLQELDGVLLETELNKLRSYLPLSTQTTTYTYRPGIGLAEMIDPNGIRVSYEYDSMGRLKVEKDHEAKILRQYEYKYWK